MAVGNEERDFFTKKKMLDNEWKGINILQLSVSSLVQVKEIFMERQSEGRWHAF